MMQGAGGAAGGGGDGEGGAKAWCTQVLDKSPVPLTADPHVVKRRSTAVFMLYLDRIDGVRLPPVFEDVDVGATVRVTFFHDGSKQVFGKTWESESCRVVEARGGRGRIDVIINQHAWFKTCIEDEDCLGIVELVLHAPSLDDSVRDLEVPVLPDKVGAGWQLVSMFPKRGERHVASAMDDIPVQRDAGMQPLDLLPGTPQVLFVLETHAIEGISSLHLQTEMQGQLRLSFIEATAPLSKRSRFVPENMLVSRYTRVPGIVEIPRPTFQADEEPETWEWIKDAALEETKPLIASDLHIFMAPSLTQFEDTLLNHVRKWVDETHPSLDSKGKEAEERAKRVTVKQRTLKIGVHNGLTYLKEPTQLPLSVERRDQSFATASATNDNAGGGGSDTDTSAAAEGGGPHLRFDGTMDLRDVVQVPECAVTLELVYTVAVPVVFDQQGGKQGRALSRALSHQQSISALPRQTEETFCLRFGCLLPFAGGNDPPPVASHTLELLGPPLPTPGHNRLFTAQQLDRDARVFLTKQFCNVYATMTVSVADVNELLNTRGEDLGQSMRNAMVRAMSYKDHRASALFPHGSGRPQSAEPQRRAKSRLLPHSPRERTQSLHIPHLRHSMLSAPHLSHQKRKKELGQKGRAVSFSTNLATPIRSGDRFTTPHRPPSAPETSTGQKGKKLRPPRPPRLESLLEASREGTHPLPQQQQQQVMMPAEGTYHAAQAARAQEQQQFFPDELRPADFHTDVRASVPQSQKQQRQPQQRHVDAEPETAPDFDHDMREIDTTIRPDEVTVPHLPFAQHALMPGDGEQSAEFPGISRALQAEVARTRFPPVVSEEDLRDMKIPASLLPLPPGPGHMRKEIEMQDEFSASKVTLQFLALEWLTQDTHHPHLPGVARSRRWSKSVALSFKLHKLPTFVSMPLRFQASEDTQHGTAGTLFAVEGNNTLSSTPGLTVPFRLDPQQLGVSHEQLLHYCDQSAIEIHVVDAESLLPIGVASMKLSCLLRGGFRGVQSSLELDVVDTRADSDRIQFAPPRNRNDLVSAANTVAKLCLRISSIGQPTQAPQHTQRLLVATAGARDSVLINPVSGHGHRHRVQPASKLIADDPRARSVLHREGGDPEQQRKAARLRAIRAKRQELFNNQHGTQQPSASVARATTLQAGQPASSFGAGVRDSSDLKALNEYRMRQKRSVIQHALEQSLHTTVDVFASYGTKVYLEYRLHNPSHDQCLHVLVKSSSRSLQVVTNHEEWRALLDARGIRRSVEPNMFNTTRDGPLVMLRPLEELFVPLKYVLPHTAVPPAPLQAAAPHSVVRTPPPIHEKLKFESLNGVDFGSADVIVHPQEPVVDHELDLFSAQETVFRHRLRLPPSLADVSGVLCSDPDVLVHVDHTSGSHDVVLKCTTGQSPEVSAFLLVLYADNHHVDPFMTWRVAVHAVDSYTMTVQLGEVSTSTLTLRPSQPVAHARVFSSDDLQLEALPKTAFSLAGNALAEIGMRAHPTALGTSKHLVHVVDTEFRRVIYTYQVVLNVQPPHVSKAFEIVLRGVDEHVNKRIGYTNRFNRVLELSLFTSHPERIQFKHHRFVLQPGERTYIGIRALPSQTHLEDDVFVLLADQQLRLHDAFKIRLLTIPAATSAS